ncbi:unnamed protein product, partial [Closterium sp. NIES-54]
CDRADRLSLFYLTSGASPTPPATADSIVRSQWATRDAAARLAVRRHLPTTERAHFSQYRSAQTLYDAVDARYSSPATAALSRLFLPYLFPDLAAFPTVADLITHLRTSDTRYRAELPAEFCAKNPPPLYLTLYYVVTRLPDSLRVVRDHFLSVSPTTLTVDLLEERLLAAEQSIVAVGASRGDPRTPIFEGCSPSPLLPSVASAAAADLGGFELHHWGCLTGHPSCKAATTRASPGVGSGVRAGVRQQGARGRWAAGRSLALRSRARASAGQQGAYGRWAAGLVLALGNGARRCLEAMVDSGSSHLVCDRGTLEKVEESSEETQFTATMVDTTKLPIHGESTIKLHIGALRWKPTSPITNFMELDFILGSDFLKRFNHEIDWVNRKA